MKRFSQLPLYPLLFAIYPALALFAVNIHEVSSDVLWRPLLISLAIGALLLLILRLVLRDWLKAALLTGLVLVAFFTYGRIYDLLKTTPLVDWGVVRHRFLLPALLLLLVALSILLLKVIRDLRPWTAGLNLIAIILVLLPCLQVAGYSIDASSHQSAAEAWTPSTSLLNLGQNKDRPDVYYIILDSYTRADVLQQDFGFDNTPFIDQLEKLGFYVAGCSRSNYNRTADSITSALNMDYLPEIYAEAASQGIPPDDIWVLLQSSLSRKLLHDLGYQFVTFETGYNWTTIKDADLYLERSQDSYGIQFVNPFEQMLIEGTGLSIYSDFAFRANQEKYFGSTHPMANYIGMEEFILDQLPIIADISEPTFTYAHINIAHNPYVFSLGGYLYPGDNNTTDVTHTEHFATVYIDAIEYLDVHILSIVQQILARSATPPIIIVQGDHGYWQEGYPYFSNISPILNAYYIPGLDPSMLYPTISPVNTFRLIFNTHFGGSYELLPDVSFNVTDIQHPIPEYYADCLP